MSKRAVEIKKKQDTNRKIKELQSEVLGGIDLGLEDKSEVELIEMINNGAEDMEPLFHNAMNDDGTYRLDVKYQALNWLMWSQRQIRNQDKLTPNYALVSQLSGISTDTLGRWWEDKDAINEMAKTMLDRTDHQVRLKMNLILMKILDALMTRDFTKDSTKMLANAAGEFIIKSRLLAEKSTDNRSVRGNVNVTLVQPDQ